MDQERFDRLTKLLGGRRGRREVLGGFAGAGVLARLGLGEAAAQREGGRDLSEVEFAAGSDELRAAEARAERGERIESEGTGRVSAQQCIERGDPCRPNRGEPCCGTDACIDRTCRRCRGDGQSCDRNSDCCGSRTCSSSGVCRAGGGGGGSAEFRSKIGGKGGAGGEFNLPYYLTARGSQVFVADSFNHRIQEISFVGTNPDPINQFGGLGDGNGQFALPMGIGQDPDTRELFVADQHNYRVQKLTESGAFRAKRGNLGRGAGQFNLPFGLAVDPVSRDIFVADSSNDRIQRLTEDLGFVRTWGSSGAGRGQFREPTGIAVGNNKVFVADTINNRIQVFTLNGAFIVGFGGEGGGNGDFRLPFGLAFSGGLLFVADTYNNRIQVLEPDGRFRFQFGRAGTANGQFNKPRGVAVSGSRIYVADTGNNRIQEFTLR